jgi:aryl-alcohol dehydrogenase-like predicted oxidoreductase
MKTRRIGSLTVTELGVGCNNLGWMIDETRSLAVVAAALDAGINTFDTADVYGDSEIVLGRALRGRRQDAVIITKFGFKLGDTSGGASPAYVRESAERSLKRLGVDVIDLYMLHWPDANTPIADTLGAMDDLVKAGKVREIGCSNMSIAQLREAAAAVKPGAARFACAEHLLNLLQRGAEADVVPECERAGLALLPYFPLASGLLTGKYRKGMTPPEGARLTIGGEHFGGQLTDVALSRVEALVEFAAARGHTILELAFGWLLAHAPVASVIAGATSPAQIQSNLKAASAWTLSAADLRDLDALLATLP